VGKVEDLGSMWLNCEFEKSADWRRYWELVEVSYGNKLDELKCGKDQERGSPGY